DRESPAMNDITLDQHEEDFLLYEIRDDALEAAACLGNEKKQKSSPNGCALLCISVLAHSEYLARNHVRVSRSLTALRTGSAIKLFLSDDVDLPEPLCGFCPGVDFAEGQVIIARRR